LRRLWKGQITQSWGRGNLLRKRGATIGTKKRVLGFLRGMGAGEHLPEKKKLTQRPGRGQRLLGRKGIPIIQR